MASRKKISSESVVLHVLRARELQDSQFQRNRLAAGGLAPPQARHIDLAKFDKWLGYTRNVNRKLLEAVAFLNLPTLTVKYEKFDREPLETVR
eukprot:scaffold112362_cov20-Prasinocladus_malaysianus.AAC.1